VERRCARFTQKAFGYDLDRRHADGDAAIGAAGEPVGANPGGCDVYPSVPSDNGGRRSIQSKSRTVITSNVMIHHRITHMTAASAKVILALIFRL